MSHGPTKYPPKSHCIYCGKNGVPLTDEHIVPFSLGGQHILQNASCLECADITKKFEQDVARELWGDARAS
jgi:5-methylcytosine-specific restriction endonuclease McrA